MSPSPAIPATPEGKEVTAMKRWGGGRCPKCNRGNPEKIGEIAGHTKTAIGYHSEVVQKLWGCRSCHHMWANTPL